MKKVQKNDLVIFGFLNHSLRSFLAVPPKDGLSTELLPNIFDGHDLNICGNAYVVKAQTMFKLLCPNCVSR
jgi:hypothetical protein